MLEQAEEDAVLGEHGEPLGFRGMGGKHRLDAHFAHGRGDRLGADAGFLEAFELIAPKAAFGGEAELERVLGDMNRAVFGDASSDNEEDEVRSGKPAT